ncbi:MAG: SDR family NAD(P)-dependent oxidoreductase [Candidatus Lokiarchaeota archaeon]|nr:SDR family NAD(P)-dependent oxidoreductase [Candidatus Lokiarchaeota archaeon]
MKEFKDKVAVVTGAASGIGRGLARRAAREGMKVVLADIEKDALNQTEEELKRSGANVISVITDVSKLEDIENLARLTINAFGEVHILCNNAGVGMGGFLWDCTLTDFNWVIGVNLWGVIHGIRTFIPIMLKQNNDCHIVNTASMSGLITGEAANGIYSITKHGVVALSESLRTAFPLRKSKIGVSVVCPGIVNTRITDCERNRPAELCGPNYERSMERFIKRYPKSEETVKAYTKMYETGTSPDQAGDIIFECVKKEIFYIFTETGIHWKEFMKTRFEGILKDFDQNNSILENL